MLTGSCLTLLDVDMHQGTRTSLNAVKRENAVKDNFRVNMEWTTAWPPTLKNWKCKGILFMLHNVVVFVIEAVQSNQKH